MSMLTTPDIEAEALLEKVAETLCISEEDALREGLRTLLARKLREVQSDIFEITGRYDVGSVEEMEARYREGTLEEATTWRDLQTLDRLEYQRDRLRELLDLLP
ncbi:MAG: hypothetical protein ACP5HG_17875 [Anaerolineae bacterium]